MSIKPEEECLIGAGYTHCKDLGFSAVKLFDALMPEIISLQESRGQDFLPQVHEKITDLSSFVETFLYFFSKGSNAEFVSLDKDLFFMMIDRLYAENAEGERSIYVNEEIGGHASVWAIRAQFEKCKSYVTPYPSEFTVENLRRKEINGGEDLILPLEHISVTENATNKQDVHLVFEYVKGDEILNFVAPRSNRFYFVHDPNGASLAQLEEYHAVLDKVDPSQKPYRHLFGGYQLMQILELEEAEQRLSKMAQLWSVNRQEGPGP